MKTDSQYEEMHNDWSRILGSTIAELKQAVKNDQLEELKKLKSSFNASALTIVDIEKNTYLYVDDDIKNVTGYPKSLYLSVGPKGLLSKAIIGHIPKLVSTTIHQRRFVSKLNPQDLQRYVFNRELCYKGNPKKWVLHQVLKYLTNPQGHIFAVVTLQTAINRFKSDNRFRYYIFDREANKVIHPSQQNKVRTSSGITDRELEIMKLVAKGLSSSEVSEELGISYHTVRTHRKNIFKKLGCRNVLEMAAHLNRIINAIERSE